MKLTDRYYIFLFLFLLYFLNCINVLDQRSCYLLLGYIGVRFIMFLVGFLQKFVYV